MSKMALAVIGTFLGTLALVVMLSLVYLHSGAYPIGASSDPGPVQLWVFTTVLDNSVRKQAERLEPPRLTDEMARRGAASYDAMCVTCHGAPGRSGNQVLRQGLNPRPPDMVDAVEMWSTAELFWITKHGIEHTGMPAWGETHSDEELWDIVAFAKRLPQMTPEQYREMLAGAEPHAGAEAAPSPPTGDHSEEHSGHSHAH